MLRSRSRLNLRPLSSITLASQAIGIGDSRRLSRRMPGTRRLARPSSPPLPRAQLTVSASSPSGWALSHSSQSRPSSSQGTPSACDSGHGGLPDSTSSCSRHLSCGPCMIRPPVGVPTPARASKAGSVTCGGPPWKAGHASPRETSRPILGTTLGARSKPVDPRPAPEREPPGQRRSRRLSLVSPEPPRGAMRERWAGGPISWLRTV